MTDDLVKRLRQLRPGGVRLGIIDDAADRIEKLEERVEDLESFQECACAYDKPTDICAFHKQLFDKITTVRLDRIEKLEAALRPFAKWADWHDDAKGTDVERCFSKAQITVGDLRAARKALEGKDD
jgi:hypothetical protein